MSGLPALTGNTTVDSILYGIFLFLCAFCFMVALGGGDDSW